MKKNNQLLAFAGCLVVLVLLAVTALALDMRVVPIVGGVGEYEHSGGGAYRAKAGHEPGYEQRCGRVGQLRSADCGGGSGCGGLLAGRDARDLTAYESHHHAFKQLPVQRAEGKIFHGDKRVGSLTASANRAD